jgi:hypothetical protein
MPIQPGSIRRPLSPVAKTYVPPDGFQYKVKDNDSWISLARGNGIAAWELIRYNYPGLPAPQQAAPEVNWYLQEYVGCTQLTPDKRNYMFSSSASPGKIWIPNMPTADKDAKKLVLATLRGWPTRRIDFSVGRIYIRASDYERVAKAIEADAIRVKADVGLSSKAYYNPATNRMTVNPEQPDEPLIVHEATHAIFDLRAIPTIVEESEGIAYIAQALYGLIKNGPRPRYIVSPNPGNPMSWAAWQIIFDESSRLADMILLQPRLVADDAAELFRAIRNTGAGWYRDRIGKLEINDGVDGY